MSLASAAASVDDLLIRMCVGGLTGGHHPLGDRELVDLLKRFTPLLKVNPFDVLVVDVVLAVDKRLDLVLHEVEDVQPAPQSFQFQRASRSDGGVTHCM